MARVILGSYMVRYPLGGMMSWALQYLLGFQALGHDVWFVEKAGYPNSCFDPSKGVMSDDPSYGIKTLHSLLARFDLQDHWCFVDRANKHHGLSQEEVQSLFNSADVFVDMGTHGSWLREAEATPVKVLIDGEPGFTQMKMDKKLSAGESLPRYDFYYSSGRNIGTERSTAPTAGKEWRPIFHPVSLDLFLPSPIDDGAPLTTVMNWQSYEPLEYGGKFFGHKDVEFEKFMALPGLTDATLEVAIAGGTPSPRLQEMGWRIRDAHEVTISFDAFAEYIRSSGGEFSVCKNAYVATNSGWFSDRGAAYLASGRPVIQQETGFGEHLPCGEGLFAVSTAQEGAEAIDDVRRDPERHSRGARSIAAEYLDGRKVLSAFLQEIGL